MPELPSHLIRTLPSFDTSGNLPSGDYAPTQREFESRFVRPGMRERIYNGFLELCDEFGRVGIALNRRVMLGGSYITTKEVPNDLDLCIDISTISDESAQELLATVFSDKRVKKEYRQKYFCEVFPIVSSELSSTALIDFFAVDRQGNTKGRIWRTIEGFEELEASPDSAEIEYLIGLDDQLRLTLRAIPSLGFYAARSDTGVLVPSPNLLTLRNQQFTLFTPEQVEEFEALLNDLGSNESTFQKFFEKYPQFLKVFDFTEVYPHVALSREEEELGSLIPDFILTNSDNQSAVIVDIKRPQAALVRDQKNRRRFASSMSEVRAQLLEYRDWFEQPANRERLESIVGMRIYRPQLGVIIGRSFEFLSQEDRQKLCATEPLLRVATFDDILRFAQRRRLPVV